MYGKVGEAVASQGFDIPRPDRSRSLGEFVGVRHQSPFPVRKRERSDGRGGNQAVDECGLGVGGHSLGREDATEARSVVVDSIWTVIESRNADRENLSLSPGEWPGSMHEFTIKLVVLSHDRRVDRVDLDDVIRIRNALAGRELAGGNVSDESHLRSLPPIERSKSVAVYRLARPQPVQTGSGTHQGERATAAIDDNPKHLAALPEEERGGRPVGHVRPPDVLARSRQHHWLVS